MNLEELKAKATLATSIVESTINEFGDKANNMTFIVKENGVSAFLQSKEWFMWYWLDNSTMTWRPTHMLKDENWLYHE